MGSVLKGTIETAGGGNAKGSSPQAYFLMKLVREPVIPEDVYSVEEVARLLHISPDRVRSFAARDNNPLPIRHFKGGARGSLVLGDELIDWLKTNTVSAVEEARNRRREKYDSE